LRSIDERMVFVVGSPRSGTSFSAGSLGAMPGFVDLGEVNALKAVISPFVRRLQTSLDRRNARDEMVAELRHLLVGAQRMSLAAGRRCVEQTPESTFLIRELAQAFPEASFVHVVRDGRDVVCSLLERGWLAGTGGEYVAARAEGNTADDAGQPFGAYARFWVEPGREDEFEAADEVRRCAWAWRRYAETALVGLNSLPPARSTVLRYEELVADPAAEAQRLTTFLGTDVAAATDALATAFGRVHGDSLGRWRRDLDDRQAAIVLDEAGATLRALGYAFD
jgi:hypothetical protein